MFYDLLIILSSKRTPVWSAFCLVCLLLSVCLVFFFFFVLFCFVFLFLFLFFCFFFCFFFVFVFVFFVFCFCFFALFLEGGKMTAADVNQLSTVLSEIKYWILCMRPIRVVEQGNYRVIVVTECCGVQHPMISMLFIS